MATSGPRRDRRKPLRPRQIILAVIVALGVGALLGSGALVGLAERQPLSTQRDVALGAAKVADRVAHLLSLNRPAEELAAALDGTEEVYDVEALIARARATALAAPETPPEPDGAREEESTVTADNGETAADTPAEPDESDPGTGPPQDRIFTPVEGIDCVPEEDAAPQPTTDDANEPLDQADVRDDPATTDDASEPLDQADGRDDPDTTDDGGEPLDQADGRDDPDTTDDASEPLDQADGRDDPDTTDDASEPLDQADGRDDPDTTETTTGPEGSDDSSPAQDSDEETGDDEPDGSDDSSPAQDSDEETGDDELGDNDPDGARTGSETESGDPTDCLPGYVSTGLTEPPTDTTTSQEADPTDAETTTTTMAEDGITEPPLFDAPRTPDADDRLAMYVGGDSISRDLGEGLARITPVDLVRIDLDPRPATGLSRPDFFDWSQHLAGVLTESVPDVIVVLFGANDFQNVEYEGEILDRFGDEWLELYRERVDLIMTLLSQPDTQTVWVGQPPVRESQLSGGLARMNEVYEEVAAEHPQVTFVDTWALFSDEQGSYTDEIDGVRLRREDGVHLTIAGGNRLAEAVWDVIGPAWGLDG